MPRLETLTGGDAFGSPLDIPSTRLAAAGGMGEVREFPKPPSGQITFPQVTSQYPSLDGNPKVVSSRPQTQPFNIIASETALGRASDCNTSVETQATFPGAAGQGHAFGVTVPRRAAQMMTQVRTPPCKPLLSAVLSCAAG